MSAAGIGKLSPNIIMLGFMHSWKERTITDMCSYYNIIHDAFTYNYGVVILHAPQGIFPLLDDFYLLFILQDWRKHRKPRVRTILPRAARKNLRKRKTNFYRAVPRVAKISSF